MDSSGPLRTSLDLLLRTSSRTSPWTSSGPLTTVSVVPFFSLFGFDHPLGYDQPHLSAPARFLSPLSFSVCDVRIKYRRLCSDVLINAAVSAAPPHHAH